MPPDERKGVGAMTFTLSELCQIAMVIIGIIALVQGNKKR